MLKQANLSFSVTAQANGNETNAIQFSTQDKKTAKLIFTIKEDKKPLNLTDIDGEITLVMQDKSRFVGKAEVTKPLDGVLEYTLTQEQIRHAGRAQGEVILKAVDGSSVGGFRFNFTIKKALMDEDLGPVKEFYIQDLEAVKQDVRQKADAAASDINNLKAELETIAGNLEEEYQNKAYTVDEKLADVQATVNDLRENGTGIDAQARQEVEQFSGRLADTEKNKLNASSFGAFADNKTDNYSALNNLFKESHKDLVYDNTVSSNRFITKSINIPSGVYRIKQADLLKDLGGSGRAQNLVINGNGAVLIFEGFEGNCFENNDRILNVDFYNLTFISLDDSTAANRILFKSISHGGAQGIKFHSCTFSGKMKYGIQLEGSNTNSEWVFNECRMVGAWESFLYIGNTNTSDQFLNYWFNKCKYWTSHNWITAYKGGHFKLDHCDISGFSPTSDTYLFRLLGGAHAYGVTTFIDDGCRYELKTAHAKVIHCEWDGARVSFENSDMSSNYPNSVVRTDVFHFTSRTTGDYSNYSFTNCFILGRFKLDSGNLSTLNNLYIKECCLLGDSTTSNLEDVFTFAKGVNSSEFIKVNIINSKFKNKIYNTVLNRLTASNVFLSNNAFLSQNPSGLLNADWKYSVRGEILIDELCILTRQRGDGNTYNFIVASNSGMTITQIESANTFKVSTMKNIYIGNRITLGTSNIIYTVNGLDYANNRIIVDGTVDSGVAVGDIVEYAIVNVSFTPTREPKQERSTSKYITDNDLYLKNIGAAFPTSGIPARIIVKTLE